MPVTIEFAANVEPIRAAIDKVIADVKGKPVTVPVQGSGQGGALPTVAGVSASAAATATATATVRSAVPTVAGVIGAGAGGPLVEPIVMGQKLTKLEPHLQQFIAQNDPISAAFLAQRGGTTQAPPTTAAILGPTVQAAPTVAGVASGAPSAPIRLLANAPGTINLLPLPSAATKAPPPTISQIAPLYGLEVDDNGEVIFPGSGRGGGRGGGGGPFGGVGRRGMGSNGPAASSVFWGRGFTGIGLGYLANFGFKLAGAGREFDIDTAMAGNNQRAQLEAMLAYRSKIVGSVPLIGEAMGFLQDPSGMDEIALRSTLGASAAQDIHTRGMSAGAAIKQSLIDSASVAGASNPFERRLRQARASHEEEMRKIDDRQRMHMEAEDERIRDVVTSGITNERIVARFKRDFPDAPADAREHNLRLESAKQSLITEDTASLRREAAASYERSTARPSREAEMRRYSMASSEDLRDERLRRLLESTKDAGEFETLSREASNNPRGAMMSALRNRMVTDVIGSIQRRDPLGITLGRAVVGMQRLFTQAAQDTRELGYLDEDISARGEIFRDAAQTRGEVQQAILARKPLSAEVTTILGRRDQTILSLNQERRRALRDPDVINDTNRQKKINDQFDEAIKGERLNTDLEIRNARQSFGDEALLRQTAMMGRGRALDAALAGGVYGAVAASSVEISEQAKLTALQMKLSGREFGPGGANLVDIEYQNAIKQEKLLARNYERQFRPTEVNPMLVDTTGRSAGSQEAVKTLENILQEIRNLNQKFDLGVK